MHFLENDWVARGSRGTASAERTGMREHVRPSVTRAEEVVANASGENFPVALRVLPARHRRHLTNLYYFARLTDDLGDEARDVQAGTVQAGTVQAGTVQAGTVQAGTVQAGTVQAGTVQAGTVQAGTG